MSCHAVWSAYIDRIFSAGLLHRQHSSFSLTVLTVALATGLRPSVCLSVCPWCMYCGKRCVLEQKLLRIGGIDWYQNDLLHRGRLRPCQPLRHIRHWTYRKPLEIEAWFHFQRSTNTKWTMGNRMVTWPITSHDPERSNSWVVTPIYLEPESGALNVMYCIRPTVMEAFEACRRLWRIDLVRLNPL